MPQSAKQKRVFDFIAFFVVSFFYIIWIAEVISRIFQRIVTAMPQCKIMKYKCDDNRQQKTDRVISGCFVPVAHINVDTRACVRSESERTNLFLRHSDGERFLTFHNSRPPVQMAFQCTAPTVERKGNIVYSRAIVQ